MDDLLKLVLVAVIILLLTHNYLSRRRKGPNYPPGPIGLPFLGYLLYIDPNPALTFIKLSKKYGKIISVKLGAGEWVVLNDFDSIREAFVKQGDKFSGRPVLFITHQISEGHGIILLDYGDDWKSQRKFGIKTLRGFGLGKTSLEERINEEAKYLIEVLKNTNEEPLNCQSALTNAVSNIICSIVMGSRFSYDDERFQNITFRLSRSFSDKLDATLLALMTLVPTFRYFPIFSGAYKRQFEDLNAIFDTIREFLEEHRNSFDPNNIRDFIDAYLLEMKNADDRTSFTEKQMFHYVRDLFVAGTDTTSNSLRWCILFLLHKPEGQDKIFNEIKAAIGDDKPSVRHRSSMPYTCAFIQEVMRHRPLLPLMAPHKTSGDVTLKGYKIPKGTSVMANMWAVHHDPDYFENPEEFRPERFIDENGRYVPCDHVLSFSMGPRHCLGDQLVNMEMFIFLTSMLREFSFSPDPKKPPPSYNKGVLGFTYVPHQFKVRFVQRNSV